MVGSPEDGDYDYKGKVTGGDQTLPGSAQAGCAGTCTRPNPCTGAHTRSNSACCTGTGSYTGARAGAITCAEPGPNAGASAGSKPSPGARACTCTGTATSTGPCAGSQSGASV